MKINTESWHYKIGDWFWADTNKFPPRTICGYFWSIVGILPVGALLCIMFTFVFVVAAAFSLVPAAIIAAGIWAIYSDSPVNGWPSYLMIAVGVFIYGGALLRWIKARRPGLYVPGETFAGVAVGYVSAAKSRVCPVIEYVDSRGASSL